MSELDKRVKTPVRDPEHVIKALFFITLPDCLA
jgi:hypothetical protein